MKKYFGIFSVVLIVGTMFFGPNLTNNSKTDVDLIALMAMNVANSESVNNCLYTGMWLDRCSLATTNVIGCISSSSSNCSIN